MGLERLSPEAKLNHLKIKRKKASIRKKEAKIAKLETYPKDELGNPIVPKGNPAWVEGVSGNPSGKPKGSMNVWSTDCINRLGIRSKEIIEKIISKALDDDDKDQANMLKLCIERILPQQKAVQVTGKDGKELSIQVVVNSIETFKSVETIDAEVIED